MGDEETKDSVPEKRGTVGDSSIFLEGLSVCDLTGESGRYHLYASLACPWAHKTLLARKLKGLESVVGCTIVDWAVDDNGWAFSDRAPWCTPDINGCRYVREVYSLAAGEGGYSGKATLPLLWDTRSKKVISNESLDIVRFLNSKFNDFFEAESHKTLDLRPEHLVKDIDDLNDWITSDINHGVYAAGLATTQDDYDEAVRKVFAALDRADDILATRRYLTGSKITEPDLGLFVSLVRFDAVYSGLFKCNARRIVDYRNLWPYLRDVYQVEGVESTVDMEHIKKHYETSMKTVNPSGIVSVGPHIDFLLPHTRHLIGQEA